MHFSLKLVMSSWINYAYYKMGYIRKRIAQQELIYQTYDDVDSTLSITTMTVVDDQPSIEEFRLVLARTIPPETTAIVSYDEDTKISLKTKDFTRNDGIMRYEIRALNEQDTQIVHISKI